MDLTKSSRYYLQLDSYKKNNFVYVLFGAEADWNMGRDNLVLLKDYPEFIDISILSCCEAPDVLLVDCNIFSASELTQVYQLMIKLSEFTVFINASDKLKSDASSLILFSGVHDFKVITSDPGMLIVESVTKCITQNAFSYNPCLGWIKKHILNSTTKEKTLEKSEGKSVKKNIWHCGINLCTVLSFTPILPTLGQIENQIYKNFSTDHADFTPWNIIVQGENLIAIDNDRRKSTESHKYQNLCMCLNAVYNSSKGLYPVFQPTYKLNGSKLSPACLKYFRQHGLV